MSNIGPCNYPMYKQLTQSRYSDLSIGGPLLVTVLLYIYLCIVRSGHREGRWSDVTKLNFIRKSFSDIPNFDDLTELWLTAPAGSGDGSVPYNKMPISPLTAPR